ncbi:MAG: hypothetical protein AAGI68_11825 [Planctomycetota bacterium]
MSECQDDRLLVPEQVMAAVSAASGWSVVELRGRGRVSGLVQARAVAVWLMREACRLSWPEVVETGVIRGHGHKAELTRRALGEGCRDLVVASIRRVLEQEWIGWAAGFDLWVAWTEAALVRKEVTGV